MTKITEDLLIARGFQEVEYLESFYELIIKEETEIDDCLKVMIFLDENTLFLWKYFEKIVVTSNLQYIEDLDKFIAICNL